MNFAFCADPLGAVWPEALALLIPAMERSDDNDQVTLETLLSTGHAQLWLATTDRPVAAMVTTGDDTTLEVWLAGGAVMSGCVPFLGIVEGYAKAGGATVAKLCGRKGWRRVLAPWGYRVAGDDLIKELT